MGVIRWTSGWRYVALSSLPLVISTTVALYLVAQIRLSHDLGRNEAIQRYRDECLAAGKQHERQFTLLYVDEYRASNCESAIRHIWGADAVKPWLAEQERLEKSKP